MARAAFISLDGLDGTGKSTQCRLLADRLRSAGHTVTTCADPGGTALSTAAGALASSLASSCADGDHPYGLIDGYAGAALVLHDLASQAPGSWTRCLLLT